MATFYTRMQSKIDTYAQWMTNDPVLLNGEIAIATVPAEAGAVKQEPAVLIKVGDGENKFSALPWVSGLAANVSSWALGDKKPVYNADEIVGLADKISGAVHDTNTQYNLVQDASDAHILKLMSKNIGDEAWTEVARITTADTKYDSQIAQHSSAITALQGLVGSTSVATQIGEQIAALKLSDTYEAKGAAATALTDAKSYADSLAKNYDRTGAAASAEAAAKAYADSLAANYDEAGAAADAESAAKAYADSLAKNYDAAGAATTVKNELQGSINTLSGRVGANASAIETLNGTGDGSVDAKITAAFNDFSTKVSNDNVVNTYKELIDYAAAHGSEFTTLVGKVDANTKNIATNTGKISTNTSAIATQGEQIQANADAISDLEDLVGTTKVSTQISNAIAAQKISETYATKSALNATNSNVTAAQNAAGAAQTAANAAQATADGAQDAADAAQSTANEAKTAAGTAQSTANTAKTTAEQAISRLNALAPVASSGKITDLAENTEAEYIVFNCGSASKVM